MSRFPRVIHSVWQVPTPSAIMEPLQVTGLTATASGQTTINLSWTADATPAPNGATYYVVYRSSDGLSYSVIAANVTTNSYSDTTLSASQQRWYRVSAGNAFGEGLQSAAANATTAIATPTAPSGLTATATSRTQINLAWTDNANNETGFKVERSTDNTNWTEIAGALAANTTSYSATGLTASTLYYFRVRAYNAGGNSAYTSSASATTQAGTYNVEYLVVAGGGGGGVQATIPENPGGGGGGGGYRTATGFSLTQSVQYTITVGAGGAVNASGSNSVFSSVTSLGGGAGGASSAGSTGGSGGGGGGRNGGTAYAGGSGTSGQGNAGGNGINVRQYGAGGGGGAGGAGGNGVVEASGGNGGAGGAASASSISGSSVNYGGGGGGGSHGAGGTGGSGAGNGAGWGGTGGTGTANRGGGGGGAYRESPSGTAGAGGSGVVIIRMPTANYSGTTTGSPTVTTSGSDTILTYNASGTYTA